MGSLRILWVNKWLSQRVRTAIELAKLRWYNFLNHVAKTVLVEKFSKSMDRWTDLIKEIGEDKK